MRLHAILAMMPDGTQVQFGFLGPERRLRLRQLHVRLAQILRLPVGQVRTQDVAQVGQIRVYNSIFCSVRGDFAGELLTTFGISNMPFRLAQAGGQLDAEAVEEDALGLVRRGDAADAHVASR